MTPKELRAVTEELLKTAELFGEAMSAARIAVYLETLGGRDPGELRRALALTRETCRFFPRPAEVLEAMRGSVEELAEQAWMGVNQAGWAPLGPGFSEHATRAAVDAVGGIDMLRGRAPVRSVPFLHREFVKTFCTVYRMHHRERRMGALGGRTTPALPSQPVVVPLPLPDLAPPPPEFKAQLQRLRDKVLQPTEPASGEGSTGP